MSTGRVKWFSDSKGYGFISTPEVDEDVFVHFSSIAMDGFRTLKPDMDVDFELVRTDKGYLAQLVRPNQQGIPVSMEASIFAQATSLAV